MDEVKLVLCEVCQRNKTAMSCDKCSDPCCKSCSYIIDEDTYDYIDLMPESLRHKNFCQVCYNNGISEELVSWQDTLARAQDVDVYSKIQGSETRFIKREAKPVKVVDCKDREEALIHLAFLAADQGYDTLVDTDITSRKIHDASYKKFVWSGTAVPVKSKK